MPSKEFGIMNENGKICNYSDLTVMSRQPDSNDPLLWNSERINISMHYGDDGLYVSVMKEGKQVYTNLVEV